MELLYLAAAPLSPVLADLYNQCISEGVYPMPLKISKISPLFKGKGKREDIDCYRPVSIIPAVAKVLENGLSLRITNFLTATDALSTRQYAYRAGRSTDAMARVVVRRVMDARERGQHVAVLCCDLSKAFDVADHGVLAMKLRHYGIEGKAHALILDILHGRSQVVVTDGGNVRSEPVSTTMGVEQGSSISNILFSLLLNDLPDAIQAGDIYMYADDVAAVVCAPDINKLEQCLNEVATELSTYFKNNGLVLNLKKTSYMNFHLGGRSPRDLTVFVDGIKIEQVKNTTFLGFELDRGLQWGAHIQKVCSKLGSACFALRRLARVLPRAVVRSCYFATVHSLLQYGADLWGRAADWERVFIMQKRAVRAIVQVDQGTSARPYFKELRILTLPSVVICQVALYVRGHPDEYVRRADGQSKHMRYGHRIVGVAHRLKKSTKLTHVMGPTVYNRLPARVTDAPSLASFKSQLKRWLIEHTFYSFNEFTKYEKST
jgi:hypothetical protein